MTRDEIMEKAKRYAEARWPGTPMRVMLDTESDTVIFEYAVSTVVGTVSVEDLEVEL